MLCKAHLADHVELKEKKHKEIQFQEKSTSQNKLFSFLCKATRADKIGTNLFVQVFSMQKSNNGKVKVFTTTKLSVKIVYFL